VNRNHEGGSRRGDLVRIGENGRRRIRIIKIVGQLLNQIASAGCTRAGDEALQSSAHGRIDFRQRFAYLRGQLLARLPRLADPASAARSCHGPESGYVASSAGDIAAKASCVEQVLLPRVLLQVTHGVAISLGKVHRQEIPNTLPERVTERGNVRYLALSQNAQDRAKK